ncbi:MAG: glycoside hydrolase family 16 protein, partial [Clostridia bacterium]|nr:glycoside hydrolase family 16 protein [Clostridia bacterium]
MKKIALLIVTLLVATAFSGIWCYADAPDSSYQLTLSDEFNGTELNTDMWYHRTGNPYGGRNLAENVRIANGKLYLDYTKTDGIYSGGGIVTNNYLPYGYYETKAKIFTGVNGFHSSFWTAGGILEIDCFEIDSNQGTTTAPPPFYNLHYWWADHSMLGGKSFYNNAAGNGFTSDWFVAGFEWLPGKIIFYCNGKEVGSVNPDVYSPSNLWLTAVAVPDWHKNSDGTYNIDDSKMDANGYFGSSEYEYFHYYNKKLKGVNLLGNSHFELNRNTTATNICSFTVTKNAVSLKTPYAHNGYCAAYLSDTAELGQNLNNIASGNYTFEGYFKTKGSTAATISVYDADGTLLKSASIPQCNDWTLVSLKDVSVTDSAYAVVKTTSGVLLADDLSFYCQEGDATYANYQEGDYKNYNTLPANTDYP